MKIIKVILKKNFIKTFYHSNEQNFINLRTLFSFISVKWKDPQNTFDYCIHDDRFTNI